MPVPSCAAEADHIDLAFQTGCRGRNQLQRQLTCQAAAAKTAFCFILRNGQNVRQLAAPAARFLLARHGRFTLRAECLHASIMMTWRSRWQAAGAICH